MPNLYAYDEADLALLLGAWSMQPHDPYLLTRNWEGSRLYLRDAFARRRGLVLSREGRTPFEFPESGLLDSDGRLVAWSETHEKVDPPHRVLQFANGLRRVIPIEAVWGAGVDPTGQYYFHDTVEVVTLPGGGYRVPRAPRSSTEIARVDDPEVVLVRVPFSTHSMFLRDDRLYVFGPDHTETYEAIAVHVVRIRDGAHAIERRFRIPQPRGWKGPGFFRVLDMDPWSDRVLLEQRWDWPPTPQWWLFDLLTREKTALGAGKKHGFFLRDDILGRVALGVAP